MLVTILNKIPPPRFVLIQDSVDIPDGRNILFSLIRKHLDLNLVDVNVFIFENDIKHIQRLSGSEKLKIHDFSTYKENWFTESSNNFLKALDNSNLRGVIIIDSLSHVILEYGVVEFNKTLHQILYKPDRNIVQVAAVLHEDVIQNKAKTLQILQQYTSLHMKLTQIPKKNSRVSYELRKTGGKIIKEIEEYFFDGRNYFCTKPVPKIEVKSLLPKVEEILPESFASFKITLDENEKKSREKLLLPYIRTEENSNQASSTGDGNIIYSFDDVDDWDEEDPDDDLNI